MPLRAYHCTTYGPKRLRMVGKRILLLIAIYNYQKPKGNFFDLRDVI
jgi:hypothetical protein